MQAVGTGTSMVTASALGWDSKTSGTVTVVGPYIKADVVVGVGTRTSGIVGLTGATAPAGGYTISLTNNDLGVATVPATVTISQGNSVATFTIVGKKTGTVTITAEAQGLTDESMVAVVKPTFEWPNVPTQIALGATQSIYVRTYVPGGNYYSTNGNKYGQTYQVVDQATTVSLSSENPAVVQVPATATIAAGSYNTTSFNIQAVGTGTSTLTAEALGWDSKMSPVITVP
jgi:hypothetical protein